MSAVILKPDQQNRPPVAVCSSCRGEIWHDEPIFKWDGKWICLYCFRDKVKALLEDDPVLLAYEMQLEVVRYV